MRVINNRGVLLMSYKIKPWLGTFEEELYQHFTLSLKGSFSGVPKVQKYKRNCLKCNKKFRTTESRLCSSCNVVNARKVKYVDS